MKMKRIISLILASLMSASILASCAGDPADTADPSADTSAAVGADTTTPEETTPGTTGREGAKDNLPADLNYDGQSVNIVYRNEDWYLKWDVIGTDNSGDLIHDAIWERNRRVEERLGLTLNTVPTQVTGLSNVASELKNLVFTGSDEYDAIVSTANTTVQQSLYPYLYELSNVPHLDINQPWWRKDAIMEMSLDGEHYRYLMGDNTLNDYLKCGVIYYNKAIYDDVHGDPDAMYQTVLDGEWTWDKLKELSEAAYVDDGDGVENAGDQFGLMVPLNYTEATLHMIYACDLDTYERTADGGIDVTCFQNEKTIAVIDKLIEVLHNSKGVYLSDKSIDASPEYFAENNSLFWTGRLSNAVGSGLREMESDYGILPMPKYDEDQEEYVTMIHTSATVTCVPKTVSDARIEMVGATLEAWSAEAYRTVITTFIETAMKMRYSRDALSGQVIDIVFESPMLPMLEMYNSQFNGLINTAILGPITKGNNTFSSTLKKLLPAAQNTINKYLTEIVEADQ